jgi:tight adherence protein B
VTLLLVGVLAAAMLGCTLMVLGVRELVVAAGRGQRLRVLVVEDDLSTTHSRLYVWNRRFVRTAPGRWISRQLVLAGVGHPPLIVALITAGAAFGIAWVLAVALAPVFALLGLVLGVQGLRVYIARAQGRRLEAFINQMPELARVLANATGAGLSLRTAIDLAADELTDPARTELRRVSDSMRVGADLESALAQINDRLPSREIRVLVSTLLVSAKSGGSLVTSLRDIADTLEMRKEVRREVRTVLAQAVLTGYLVVVIGVLMTAGLNVIQPGTVSRMTTSPIGQGALIISGVLYTVGLLLIRRITRIDP